MMLLCCSLASSSFTPRKPSFLSDYRLNFRMYSVQWFLLITMPSGLWFQKNFVKHCRIEIMAFPVLLFHRDCFFNFYCLLHKRFSSAYLLKRFLLPQRLYTALFIRCDKTEFTRWCLCSLYAGIQISPDEGVGNCDSSPLHCRRHCWCAHTSLQANFQCSHRVVLVPFCIICSLHLIAVSFLRAIWLPEWSPQLPSFLAFMSPRDARVLQILP